MRWKTYKHKVLGNPDGSPAEKLSGTQRSFIYINELRGDGLSKGLSPWEQVGEVIYDFVFSAFVVIGERGKQSRKNQEEESLGRN